MRYFEERGAVVTARLSEMNDQTRENLAELIWRLACIGRDDPTIAGVLGITASEVRTLRKQNDIPAGERRWLGGESGVH